MITMRNCKYSIIGFVLSTAFLAAEEEAFTIPQEFVSGAPAVAAEVNENFSSIAEFVNALNDKIADMEGQISDLEGQISDLEAEVADLKEDVSPISTETLPGTYRLILSETLLNANDETGIINHTVAEGTLTLNPGASAAISLNGTNAQLDWTPFTDWHEDEEANIARLSVNESVSGETFSGSGTWQLSAGGLLTVSFNNGPTVNFTLSQSGNTLIGSIASDSQTFVGIRLPE